MVTTRINIGHSLNLVVTDGYVTPARNFVEFEYTNEATDDWSSDSQVEVAISEDVAKQIISALQSHFKLTN